MLLLRKSFGQESYMSNTKKGFFKPEDFFSRTLIQEYIGSHVTGKLVNCEDAAIFANEKLNALIESWPVVYAYMGPARRPGGMWIIDGQQDADSTHKARLAFIEPIVKEPCKHEPIESVMIGHICMHCGVKLQATWTEKK
jgi:hypothetical protein